jgi:hypothetical protein
VISSALLILMLRVQIAALNPGTDYQCEMAEQAWVCLETGDTQGADDALQLLDEYELDQAELED